MATLNRPAVIVFDVVGTLFSLDALGERLERIGLSKTSLPLWFARTLRDAFALELAGIFKPFTDVALSALQEMAAEHGASIGGGMLKAMQSAFGELKAFDDVPAAVERLGAAGIRLIALTNGSAKVTKELLRGAAISGRFEDVVSIDGVKHWKPSRQAYLYAAGRCGAKPSDLMLVAGHAWDIQGAKSAGFRTAFVQRAENEFPAAMNPPDLRGMDLNELSDQILALKKASRGLHNFRPRRS